MSEPAFYLYLFCTKFAFSGASLELPGGFAMVSFTKPSQSIQQQRFWPSPMAFSQHAPRPRRRPTRSSNPRRYYEDPALRSITYSTMFGIAAQQISRALPRAASRLVAVTPRRVCRFPWRDGAFRWWRAVEKIIGLRWSLPALLGRRQSAASPAGAFSMERSGHS